MQSINQLEGLDWFGLVWFGLVWFGLVWSDKLHGDIVFAIAIGRGHPLHSSEHGASCLLALARKLEYVGRLDDR